MPRPKWNGRRATSALQYVLRRDGETCWLCGHPGANSLDHVNTAKDRPDLEWDPTNWKPAHLAGAGHKRGCQTTGCRCPGNTGRNPNTHQPPTRPWS